MDIDFTSQDILFIYGHFQKHIAEINKIKESPGNPFDDKTIKQRIAPFSSVTDKIAVAYPQLREMDRHMKNIVNQSSN